MEQIIHNNYECPMPSNNTFICIENEECYVDCSDIQQQTADSHFLCSNQDSKIDATKAISLTLICDAYNASCNGLQIDCPAYNGSCDISCNANQSCHNITINTHKSNEITLDCITSASCYQSS